MLERRLIALVRGSGFELCLFYQERSLPDRYVSIYTMLAYGRPVRSAIWVGRDHPRERLDDSPQRDWPEL
jgi:hypothetical protein